MRVFQQDLHLPQDLRVVSPLNVGRHLAAVLCLEGYGVLLCLWFRLFRLLPCALLLASSTAFLGALGDPPQLRIQREEEDVMVLRRASWWRSGGLGSGLATCVVAALVVARCAPLVVSAHAELGTHTRPRHMTEEA